MKKGIKIVQRAIRGDWPITEEQRQRVVEQLLAVVSTAPAGLKCKAAATLVAADNVNAKRESTDTQADVADKRQLAALLALLADPAKRDLLLGGNPPQLPPPSDDTPNLNGTTKHPTS